MTIELSHADKASIFKKLNEIGCNLLITPPNLLDKLEDEVFIAPIEEGRGYIFWPRRISTIIDVRYDMEEKHPIVPLRTHTNILLPGDKYYSIRHYHPIIEGIMKKIEQALPEIETVHNNPSNEKVLQLLGKLLTDISCPK